MFNNEFKTKVFKVAMPAGAGRVAVEALENNKVHKLRYLLEELLDDPHLYVNGNIGSNRKVKQDKKHTYESRQEVYSDLMELINNRLDSGELLPEYGIHIQ